MNENDLHLYFANVERAQALLRELVEPLLGTLDERGEPLSPHTLQRVFLDAIELSPDPDKALLNIHRMAEASFGISFVRDLVRYPVLMDLSVKIGSYSQFLSDIVVRDPELFRWLTTSEVLSIKKTKDDFLTELKKQTELFSKRETQFNAIRRLYRREILRIGVRDILELAPFDVIIAEISALADAIAHGVLELVVDDVAAKHKGSPQTSFAIIGLGKLGGNELNYSSDIDIMFVVNEDVTFTAGSGKEVHAIDFYGTVADRWIAVMTEHSREGMLYRVDARLRPDGQAGPLVRSATGYRAYYESRGELWERQMLIKARAIAGDIEFGRSFLGSLQRFMYPSTLFQSPRETISRMKARIERRAGNPNNIKLCRGGIRDIEFIVQALQLLNGGKDNDIRSGTTLTAIELLHSKRYITGDEYTAMRDAYIFFRKLEHHVQLDENIQTHVIPSDDDERFRFAKKAGFGSKEEFDKQLNTYLTEVSRIFNSVFEVKEDTLKADWLFREDILDGNGGLSEYGFKNPKRAGNLLKQLAHGVKEMGVGDHDVRTKEIFRSIAPNLLNEFSESLDPDRALTNFLSIVQSYPHPHALYTSLQNEIIRKALIRVCGYSNKLALQLSRYPGDLEMLMNHAYEILESDTLFNTRSSQYPDRFLILAAHTRFINSYCSLERVHNNLSYIAVRRIRSVMDEILRDFTIHNPSLAILSLGKLSGEEIGPDADLDLIFLFKEANGIDAVTADKIAREFIRRCSVADESNVPYEVDMRLRPEGKSGPLATELDVYSGYLDARASLWERQSLVRAKVVWGSDDIRSELEKIIVQYTYNKSLHDGWINEILEMRYRTESRSKMNRHDYVDIKTGPGGLMDIEFLVQTMQLRYGNEIPEIRTPSTRNALKRIREAGLISDDIFNIFNEAYEVYREVEYFNRIYTDDPSNLIPVGDEEQEKLVDLLKIKGSVTEYFKRITERVRQEFIRVLKNGDLS